MCELEVDLLPSEVEAARAVFSSPEFRHLHTVSITRREMKGKAASAMNRAAAAAAAAAVTETEAESASPPKDPHAADAADAEAEGEENSASLEAGIQSEHAEAKEGEDEKDN
jgi:hypothetical protein